jgi:cephalosporin-C deacetylase-like acetyl esterase
MKNYPGDAKVYGMLAIPTVPGKHPALLELPGAGVRSYSANTELAKRGIITLAIGIHGIPVNMEAGVYRDLMKGPLNQYWNLRKDHRDHYYYKRVYLGCIRAIDFIHTLPQFDQMNLAVSGGSQGGALSIATAALDQRVDYIASFYPALCDLEGYHHNRAGGWPHMFRNTDPSSPLVRIELGTMRYYDISNFARHVTQPGLYSWGYNDEICPPTSMHAAYNQITAEKELYLALDSGHWTYPEQREKRDDWILTRLSN